MEHTEEDPELDDNVFTESVNLALIEDPITWEQAEESEDANAWRTALEDEYLAQIRSGTWEIVTRPSN